MISCTQDKYELHYNCNFDFFLKQLEEKHNISANVSIACRIVEDTKMQ